jgi:hypothetical protein
MAVGRGGFMMGSVNWLSSSKGSASSKGSGRSLFDGRLRIGGVFALAILCFFMFGGAPSAKVRSHRRPRSPVLVLHPRFRVAASHVSSFTSDGRYVLVAGPSGITLIDDQTGSRTLLTPPPLCGYSYVLGGGWVLTSCAGYGNPPYQLYSIATRTWTSVDSTGGRPVAAGRDWIEYYGPVEAGCIEHCSYQWSFGDIATGQIQALPDWAPGATTIPDLNAPTLATHLCSPLRVPQGFPTDETSADHAPNPLTFAGRFAAGIGLYMRGGLWESRLLLERCGSRLHRVLTTQITSDYTAQFAINHHAVIWQNYRGGPIHGIFLPSLQKFTIALPPHLTRLPQAPLFLTSRSLYLAVGAGKVIVTTSPRPPTR